MIRRLRLLVADCIINWHQGRLVAHEHAVEKWQDRWYRWERKRR